MKPLRPLPQRPVKRSFVLPTLLNANYDDELLEEVPTMVDEASGDKRWAACSSPSDLKLRPPNPDARPKFLHYLANPSAARLFALSCLSSARRDPARPLSL